MDKEQAIEKLNDIRCHVKETSAEEQALVMAIDALKQPVATDTNVVDKISKFIDGLEEIFADLRERHVDDSVCGLCEYDGAYMGQSGDWCNECPGFDRDDCFKLSDKTRKEWTEEIIKALPTVQPVAPTESHTSKWHDLIKDPTDLPEMHDAGILKSLGIKMTSDRCFATILYDDGTRIVDVSAHLRDGKWHTDTGRWINVSGHKSEVVAWMPVIEPYRPEERKDGEIHE